MGTTLTGTTPQDTYDSLIKVTDNGPLSGTAKYLSDGLGNDSVLALSTAAVSIGTATPNTKLTVFQSGASGIATMDISGGGTGAGALQISAGRVLGTTSFDLIQNNAGAFINQRDNNPLGILVNGSERLSITSAGNVGIGTSSPESKLHIAGTASGSDVTLYIDNVAASTLNNSTRLKFSSDLGSSVSGGGAELNCTIVDAGNGAVDLLVKSWSGGAYTEKARFLAGGGLTFNGDTAAANALDDYEEGTWTMGISFGGGSTGVTYSSNTGTYTKVGRQVTVNGYVALSNKGSSTGLAALTGLPFTIPNSANHYSPANFWLYNITFANQFEGYGQIGGNQIFFQEITEAGAQTNLTNADFANNSEIMVSLTYFV